ncbi:MAG: hypothetical protein ACXABK_04505, partial [Candidatus Heimdallarchaeaceae archaeon]
SSYEKKLILIALNYHFSKEVRYNLLSTLNSIRVNETGRKEDIWLTDSLIKAAEEISGRIE